MISIAMLAAQFTHTFFVWLMELFVATYFIMETMYRKPCHTVPQVIPSSHPFGCEHSISTVKVSPDFPFLLVKFQHQGLRIYSRWQKQLTPEFFSLKSLRAVSIRSLLRYLISFIAIIALPLMCLVNTQPCFWKVTPKYLKLSTIFNFFPLYVMPSLVNTQPCVWKVTAKYLKLSTIFNFFPLYVMPCVWKVTPEYLKLSTIFNFFPLYVMPCVWKVTPKYLKLSTIFNFFPLYVMPVLVDSLLLCYHSSPLTPQPPVTIQTARAPI